MPVSHASKRVLALAIAVAGAGCGWAKADPFAAAFPTSAALPATHAVITYQGGDGQSHRLELWRDGERRLRRDTDKRLTTIVTRHPPDAAYRLDLFDHARRLHTLIDRDSLIRIGRFTDWSDLAYGLHRPIGVYTIHPVAAPAVAKPIDRCRWSALTQGSQHLRICWSDTAALPLLITDAKGTAQWQVTALDHRPTPGIFTLAAPGYALVNAGEDIQRD